MGVNVEIGEPQCQALNLSDSERCLAQATAYNELFCRFHAKQCFGLYVGYKRRNARLDALDDEAPAFLRSHSDVPIANISFKNISDPSELHEIQAHLFKLYVLLDKVIAARQLHHTHFFSLKMDYGHKLYLEKLQARRVGSLRALERVEQRTAAVLYEREQWFKWVRSSQSEEEQTRQKEQKKVKLEAAMFQRHWKELQSRLRAMREKENRKRQDAYLEQAWRERMESADDTGGDDEDWDPIEDVMEEERKKYLDLIRQFLWLEVEQPEELPAVQGLKIGDVQPKASTTTQEVLAGPVTVEDETEEEQEAGETGETPIKRKNKKSMAKSKGKKKTKKPADKTGTIVSTSKTAETAPTPQALEKSQGVGKGHIESQEEIRKRLREGINKDHRGLTGPQFIGTVQNPVETQNRTAPLPEEEIASLIADIVEVKNLLFCRTLLSHATMLPAALRAKSIGEFLDDPEIADSDLRDLCLKVEQPNLQALRDACADFARGDSPEPPQPEEEIEILSTADILRRNLMYGDLDEMNLFTTMKSGLPRGITAAESSSLDSGSRKETKGKRMKITLCGKTIWNHASEGAMARDGWLQFSIVAKDCSFDDAVSLCRNWDEFFELQTLVLWQFFPSAKWASWSHNALHEQLLHLGFIPYHISIEASRRTQYNQVGSKGRHRRQHHIEECRNIICAHMKRGDPVTNRFIDYCIMQSGDLQILVRDGKTGQIVRAPLKKERWLHRVKSGLGRAFKNEWEVVQEVGKDFFEYVDCMRDWRFSFDSYYDIFVWDFSPGEGHLELFHRLVDNLRRALRIRKPRDAYLHQRHVLEHLTQDEDTKRVRPIRSGDDARSIFDFVSSPSSRHAISTSKGKRIEESVDGQLPESAVLPYILYNDTDAAEDEILFAGGRDQGLYKEITNPVVMLENSRIPPIMLARGAQLLEGIGLSGNKDDDERDGRSIAAQRSMLLSYGQEPGASRFVHSVPPIWRQAYFEINAKAGKHGTKRDEMLERLDFFSQKMEMTGSDLQKQEWLELLQRDRSYGCKDSFHLADLEPGSREKYVESTKIILGAQNHRFATSVGVDWAWICLEILDMLDLRVWYDECVGDPPSAWPHRYLTQDITQAFVTMGLFFPGLESTKIVGDFLDSKQGSSLRGSKVFDTVARAGDIPDRRGRASPSGRPTSFYKGLEMLKQCDSWVDGYPWDWNLTVRPIIAKLYRAGIISPSDTVPHPSVCPGITFAAEEEHRPGKLDMFLRFDRPEGLKHPPAYTLVKNWPDLRLCARDFAQEKPQARFALLRLWSAPHFYPLMIVWRNRPNFTFMDPVGRAWEWKFVPKDFDESEWSTHLGTLKRLDLVFDRAQQDGGADLRRNVAIRGDAILVMAETEKELFRLSTIVTFAMQTKPWLREVDLWKSFVNVGLDFLEGLDPVWLE